MSDIVAQVAAKNETTIATVTLLLSLYGDPRHLGTRSGMCTHHLESNEPTEVPLKRKMSRKATVRTAAVAAMAAGGMLATAAAPAHAATLPEGNLANALVNYVAAPNALAGGNDWSCKPTAIHPNPVILVPGTLDNMGSTFVKTAPALKNAGYCVYSLNYGFDALSLGRASGLAPVPTSVQQLANFVTKVRASTGAAKVDLVGWSQGGLLPIDYIKRYGGNTQVAHYVGWSQSSNGTTVDGFTSLASAMGVAGFPGLAFGTLDMPGVRDQLVGSAYLKGLDAVPLPTGPKYLSILTTQDELLTPYTNGALPAPATNVTIQNYCPADQTGHIGLTLDDPTLQLTMNFLNNGSSSFKPTCTGFGMPDL
ncbi:hypothetical protein [Leekyejoonella antrihumi]|uniref:Alpha/beta fold hydrolase n=1 Tax=Leekyejoonella antrihumi TaxID=1660198 RepID=A0A563E7V6_9MICO|nr:hypothetical protein [Leekyejoonella antrihumi]TWP38616.1 hypothetical protein FGL98_02185 [Leekyejoonella antrihumi]